MHGSLCFTWALTVLHALPPPLLLAVMFLAQMYPRLGALYQERVTLLMLEACKIPGPTAQTIHPSLMPVYTDLRTAQVRAMRVRRVPPYAGRGFQMKVLQLQKGLKDNMAQRNKMLLL
eukprot:1158893-Pelagomonas_calceolata.AAC.29